MELFKVLVIGLCVGGAVSQVWQQRYFNKKFRYSGVLKAIKDETEDKQYLFLEVSGTVEDVCNAKYVVFKVETRN